MAKLKDFAVDVEYVVRETIHVTARRPNGAVDQVLNGDAYRQAHQYDCDAEDCYCYPTSLPKDAKVTNVRAL